MKYNIFLLFVFTCVVGCSKEPTPTQLDIVDRLIQEQIDVSYNEPNFNAAKAILSKSGKTVKEATERNKKQYTEIHNYLVTLQSKPYKDKKSWAITYLEITINHSESIIKSLDTSDKENKELFLLHEQRKKWLTTLKE
ncbi:MAG: hypothetical protein OEY52_02405 [Gammaproteobacteria bacterium]|nr:hypothetical protein [Gammaproteobacteria bacterium]